MPGTLFVVATPIGNLEDLTFRALRTLREVDLIAAEDTRRTAKLLAHYEIRKPMVSLREHNETRETPRILSRLERGESVALVSDAGTPTIADPGARLVAAARARKLPIVPIPGPTAIAAALSVSGFSGDQFVFLGFPPSSGPSREQWFHDLKKETRVAVFFEAPHRIERTVAELTESVKRPIILGRELTKAHEQLVELDKSGKNTNLSDIGEFVIVVESGTDSATQTTDSTQVVDMFYRLTDIALIEHNQAVELVSSHFDIPASRVKNLAKKARIEAKKKQIPLS